MTSKDEKDFLQNPDFISWRLTGDPLLAIFWENYLKENPHLKDDFELAVHKFSRIKINNETFSLPEQEELLERIHVSVKAGLKKKKTLRFVKYMAAACILTGVAVFGFIYNQTPDNEIPFLSENLIVGESLVAEDIHLIVDEELTSFSNDVHVNVDNSGQVVVAEAGSEKQKVIEAGRARMNKLVVPYGKRSQLELADGTRVWINSGSVLEFPSAFDGNERVISLMGEVYIEVAPDVDRPFLVNTREMQVRVYGTKFNISAYQENTSSLVLVEGIVGVRSTVAAKEEVRVQPSELLTLTGDGFEKHHVDVSGYVSWKDGYLLLQSTPITEVLKKIERYYNLTFSIPDVEQIAQVTCNGKLILSPNLDNVMETVSILSNTRYKRENEIIYIDINQ